MVEEIGRVGRDQAVFGVAGHHLECGPLVTAAQQRLARRGGEQVLLLAF
ncbi:hypothetical protein ACFQXA_08740 [Nocardiopsis composta]